MAPAPESSPCRGRGLAEALPPHAHSASQSAALPHWLSRSFSEERRGGRGVEACGAWRDSGTRGVCWGHSGVLRAARRVGRQARGEAVWPEAGPGGRGGSRVTGGRPGGRRVAGGRPWGERRVAGVRPRWTPCGRISTRGDAGEMEAGPGDAGCPSGLLRRDVTLPQCGAETAWLTSEVIAERRPLGL